MYYYKLSKMLQNLLLQLSNLIEKAKKIQNTFLLYIYNFLLYFCNYTYKYFPFVHKTYQ